MAVPTLVLLIEDHRDVADLYQLKLQLEGYRVTVARTADAGLSLVHSLGPDVILLDLHLPGMNGLDLLARLRAEPATRETPVVILSEDDSPELMSAASELGVSGYMVKARTLPKRLAEMVASTLSHPRSAAIQETRRAS